jgi:hypothetical protein
MAALLEPRPWPPLPDPLQQPPPTPRTGETSKYRRLFNLVGGPALIVAGFLFIPTPGPSYIIIIIGSWMVAGELLIVARFFDRTEVRLRRVGGWIKGRWSRLPTGVKSLVVLACVAALGYGAYFLFFGG